MFSEFRWYGVCSRTKLNYLLKEAHEIMIFMLSVKSFAHLAVRAEPLKANLVRPAVCEQANLVLALITACCPLQYAMNMRN